MFHLKDTIYPLVKRPFAGRMLLGPRDPRKAIDEEYGVWVLDRCADPYFANRVPCSRLMHKFNLVQHVRGPGGGWCKEELVSQGKIISTFTRSSYNIPVC